MAYKLTNSSTVVRLADGLNIPADSRNTARIAFEKLLAAGNTPDAADPVPERPIEAGEMFLTYLRNNPGKALKLRNWVETL